MKHGITAPIIIIPARVEGHTHVQGISSRRAPVYKLYREIFNGHRICCCAAATYVSKHSSRRNFARSARIKETLQPSCTASGISIDILDNNFTGNSSIGPLCTPALAALRRAAMTHASLYIYIKLLWMPARQGSPPTICTTPTRLMTSKISLSLFSPSRGLF